MVILCPKCESDRVSKNGTYQGRQGYRCKDCKRQFVVGDRDRCAGIVSLNGEPTTTKELAELMSVPISTAKKKVFELAHQKKGCYVSLPIALVADREGSLQTLVADAIASAPGNIKRVKLADDVRKNCKNTTIFLPYLLVEKLRLLLKTGGFKSRNELIAACLVAYLKKSQLGKNT